MLTVVSSFESPPSEIALSEMKRELQFIMNATGVQVEWQPVEVAEAGAVFKRLAVVRFVGKCRLTEDGGQFREGVLGFAHVTDGEILPFAEVQCDRVLESVRHAIRGAGHVRSERLFGRALGRVVAHELYHILTGNPHHDRTGVARCPLTPHEMVEGRLIFEPETAQEIRRRLLPRSRTAEVYEPADNSASPNAVIPKNVPKGNSYVE